MPIDWVTIAILGAAVLGLVSIMDSHFISRRMPGLVAYLLPLSIAMLVSGSVLFCLFPLPNDIGIWPLVISVAAGILRTASLAILFYTMKREEVSRVMPLANTYPVFVAIMAVPLLGETLYYLEWIAIVIVVAGAVIISARQSPGGSTSWLGTSFFLLVGSSLIRAVAEVVSKYALAYISFWNMTCIYLLCMGTIFILISMRPHILKELVKMKHRNLTLTLVVFNQILAVAGIALFFYAMERGPVSLVATIISSRPIFVFIYALILSRVSPTFIEWQSGKVMLVLRILATTMIVGGIAIIYLA
ncbi:MAG: DMT family transporter [Chloroflexota bacterium]|nr:MAG: DMT family transporter [Chloroflexota bacterium]